MSIFNTRVTALTAQRDALLAALATIGFDAALLEKDPQALAAHVSTLAAQEDAATAASIEKLNTDLAAAAGRAAASHALAALFTTTLTAAGVTLPADLASLTAENLRAALDAAISAKATAEAAAQVAASGHQPLALPKGGEDSAADTLDELRAQMARETDPAKKGKLAAKAEKLRWGNN